ncbi:MAG: methyltransferase [Myxococcota bacterium]
MRPLVLIASATLVAASLSCRTSPSSSASASTPAADSAPGASDPDAPPLPERFAAQLERQRAQADKIRARWTPTLRDAITELTDQPFESTEAALTAILASPHRPKGNASRDVYRNPKKTLLFFGLQPTMRVFEYGQGAGWYTEILAPLLARDGTLHLAGYDDSSGDPQLRYAKLASELFFTAPGNLYDKVVPVLQTSLGGPPNLGEPDSLDMLLVFRMMHNFHRFDMWERIMPVAHTALAPGGVLAVIQHRAADDANPDKSAPMGYLPEPWLVKKVESYGFALEARSDVNANPKDTKDYEKGVWTLPPTLQLGATDRDKYLAIGESDRSTLKFVKVSR